MTPDEQAAVLRVLQAVRDREGELYINGGASWYATLYWDDDEGQWVERQVEGVGETPLAAICLDHGTKLLVR